MHRRNVPSWVALRFARDGSEWKTHDESFYILWRLDAVGWIGGEVVSLKGIN